MVYNGPRQGCLNCKKRKRKCDNGQPACGACLKRNAICVRYEHALDAVLRDQSAKLLNNTAVVDSRISSSRTLSHNRSSSENNRRQLIVADNHRTELLGPRLDPDLSSMEAVCFFMQKYAWTARNMESTHGYIDLLQDLYPGCSIDSPLVHATTAIAVYLQEAWSDLYPESNRARRYLGKALQSVNKALLDPRESVKDETLIAVLLLDLQDSLSNMLQSRPASETHFDGVIALMSHRESLNFETHAARRLIVSVRHQIITWSNARGLPINTTAPIWDDAGHSSDLPQNKALDLDVLCLQLNRLITIFRSVMNELGNQFHIPFSGTMTLPIQLYDTFQEIKSLDERFEAWYCTMPSTWKIVPVHGVPAFDMYQATCDAYLDLNVATVINNYRVSRATLLRWQVELLSKGTGFWAQQESNIRKTFQQTLDDFCASVPFFLGNKFEAEYFDDPKIFYPGLPDDPEQNWENRRQATAYGGTILLGNLRSMLELSDSRKISLEPLVRAGQREWMMRQLLRIAIIYNVRSNPDGLGGEIPPLLVEKLKLSGEGTAIVNSIGRGVTFKV